MLALLPEASVEFFWAGRGFRADPARRSEELNVTALARFSRHNKIHRKLSYCQDCKM